MQWWRSFSALFSLFGALHESSGVFRCGRAEREDGVGGRDVDTSAAGRGYLQIAVSCTTGEVKTNAKTPHNQFSVIHFRTPIDLTRPVIWSATLPAGIETKGLRTGGGYYRKVLLIHDTRWGDGGKAAVRTVPPDPATPSPALDHTRYTCIETRLICCKMLV